MKKIFVMFLVLVGIVSFGFFTFAWGETKFPKDTISESLLPNQIGNTTEEQDVLNDIPEEYLRMTVPFLRSHQYPGSQIVTERVLAQKQNYTSYLAWYESEGFKIYGLLTKPTSGIEGQTYPAVVFMHGYIPPLSYRTTEKYGDYVDYLARNGLVVFKIDFRGNGDSEGEPGGAYFSGDYVIDAINAYESLKTLDYVASDRVGLWGHSMSGNVVLRAMVARPEIPTGVIWAGAVYSYADMAEYGINDSSYQPGQNPHRPRRADFFETVGERGSDSPFWQATAATNFAADLKGKIQLHHATNDPVVTVKYSQDLVKVLDEAGVDNRLYEYNSGGHNLGSPAFGIAMQRTVAWFKSTTD
ncbi:alpha/beta hydrolase family protein [Pseudomonadota bacterium]